jgi:tetratricopeptide (TPR) repeat protein
MHRLSAAEEALRQALTIETVPAIERARWLMAWADLDYDRGHDAQAQQHYDQALALADNQPELVLGIRLGLAELAPQPQKLNRLLAIREALPQISDPVLRSRYWFTLGTQANALGSVGTELAYHSLEQARQLAPAQSRLWIESLDGLAQVYESRQRFVEALRLNQAAIPVAEQLEAHDLLINLYWRQGRLYRQQQQLSEATAAYQQAVDHIEAIRHDIPLEYHHGRSSFRELLEPVYLGLADSLLLQASGQSTETEARLLKRARDAVELIKQFELEDFLGGRCALQGRKQVSLDSIATSTAVVYPILLPDRLELLVSSGSEIAHFSQPVPAARVQAKAKELAFNLRNNHFKIKPLAIQLY